jgi:hypothetical protein
MAVTLALVSCWYVAQVGWHIVQGLLVETLRLYLCISLSSLLDSWQSSCKVWKAWKNTHQTHIYCRTFRVCWICCSTLQFLVTFPMTNTISAVCSHLFLCCTLYMHKSLMSLMSLVPTRPVLVHNVPRVGPFQDAGLPLAIALGIRASISRRPWSLGLCYRPCGITTTNPRTKKRFHIHFQ